MNLESNKIDDPESSEAGAAHWSRDWELISKICEEYTRFTKTFKLARQAHNASLDRHFSWLVENCQSSISYLRTLLKDEPFRQQVGTVFARLPKDVLKRTVKDAEDVAGDMCFRIFYKVLRNSCKYQQLQHAEKEHWGSFLWCGGSSEINLSNCTPFETEVFRCVDSRTVNLDQSEVAVDEGSGVFDELYNYVSKFPDSSAALRKALAEDLGSAEGVDISAIAAGLDLTEEQYRKERDRFFKWIRREIRKGNRREI